MSLGLWITATRPTTVHDDNVTYNLAPMLRLAGFWDDLYESNDAKAETMIPKLRAGLDAMLSDPDKFKALNPANGWGDYYGAVRFTRGVLEACVAHPDGVIGLSR